MNEFEKLRSDANVPLFPGYEKYTRLTRVLKLLQIKMECGWSRSGFSKMFDALHDLFPDNNVVPKSMYEAKKIVSMMGMECEKIHACRNDCVLYRKEYVGLKQCPKCNDPRYNLKKDPLDDDETNTGIPVKAMCYLPIVPR